ncbi:MAG: hypothetical protein HY369_03580 [Candidatus Aenigmarchaeota archaeon]|nr:hypothetical protein [Candidatus Aenigmarchaeota archaeon]
MAEYRYRNGDPLVPITVIGRRQSLNLVGYVDTGASTIVVPRRVKNDADLVWLGATMILTVGGIIPEDVYLARVRFEGQEFDVSVLCRDLPGSECLIGRDVIDRFLVLFDGPRKVLSVTSSDGRREAA